MADEMSEEPKITLRLIIDEEKNNLMTLPMGTIVGLLKKHQNSEIGCFSNLYKSVADMSIDSFMTGACKQMLLNPRSVKEAYCKRLKLNLNPTDDHLKYFKCPSFSSCNMCSDFSGSDCACGRSSFIITDDLKVSVDSTGLVLKTLNSLGCSDVSKLGEQLLDIGLSEMMHLLECVFSSNTPLTDALLKKQSPQDMTNMHKSLSPCLETKTDVSESEFSIDAIVRKQDMKILYVECGEDFVDLLFSFLAVPLEYVCDTSSGCIGNLRKSFKDLTAVDKEGLASECVMLPHYYKLQKQLSVITTEEAPVYYRYRNSNPRQPDYSLTTDYDRTPLYRKDRIVPVTVIDPKSQGRDHRHQSENGSGFVKRGTRFTVSDDLMITPRGCLSTSMCFLKKYEIKADDVDVQVIRICEEEVMNVLRASLGTTSALNTALWNLIAKKPKMET
ncbi:BnaA10g27490D [Brassica napus]|uniref:BnaA10g27490D protein n=1 Tax=Brassica napus TaxID=3708 RepID=A0A078HSQ5_BRANA|nr:BnaA10g27490D [Brassica napus]